MSVLRNIYRSSKTILSALLILASVSSCIKDDLSECGLFLRVTVASSVGSSDAELGNAVSDVMLYIFDENEILLAMFPSEIGKIEHLNYPKAEKLHVVATANVDSQVSLSSLVVGQTTLSDVKISLKEGQNYLGYDCYTHPSDILTGDFTIDNVPVEDVLELPITRKVAAVTVRVKQLREYLGALDAPEDDFTIVLGTQYNYLNFLGESGLATRADSYPVNYKLTGGFRTAFEKEYFEAPKQVSPEKTDFVRTISTSEGSPVSVSIYYKGQLVPGTPVTHYDANTPITVKNNMLNVILISFGKEGQVSVRINEAQWNSYVEIEKDFTPEWNN